jgi:hypothetical protein
MGAAVALGALWTGPVLTLSALVYLVSAPDFVVMGRCARWVRRHVRRQRQQPTGRPIEQIAVDARRLGRQLRHADDGRSRLRIDAIRRAYDDVLGEGCRALGFSHLLGVLTEGAELDAERRRVEVVLLAAGMVLEDVY